jgi:hypothetical protein
MDTLDSPRVELVFADIELGSRDHDFDSRDLDVVFAVHDVVFRDHEVLFRDLGARLPDRTLGSRLLARGSQLHARPSPDLAVDVHDPTVDGLDHLLHVQHAETASAALGADERLPDVRDPLRVVVRVVSGSPNY